LRDGSHRRSLSTPCCREILRARSHISYTQRSARVDDCCSGRNSHPPLPPPVAESWDRDRNWNPNHIYRVTIYIRFERTGTVPLPWLCSSTVRSRALGIGCAEPASKVTRAADDWFPSVPFHAMWKARWRCHSPRTPARGLSSRTLLAGGDPRPPRAGEATRKSFRLP